MLLHRFFQIILVFGMTIPCTAQQSAPTDMLWADSIMEALEKDQEMDFEIKSILADSIFNIYRRHGEICKQIFSRVMNASYLDKQGKPDVALGELFWALQHYHPPCDSNTYMAIQANFTNIYLSLEEFNRVDSISHAALALWNPSWTDHEFRYTILNNLAIAQASLGELDLAGQTFRQIYSEADSYKDTSNMMTSLANLGSLKGMTGDLDSAFYFLPVASVIARRTKSTEEYMDLLINLSIVDAERGRFKPAAARLDSTYNLATEIKSVENQAKVQKARSALHARFKDYKNAYTYILEYIDLNNEYLSKEKVKAVTEMMEKYESEKKARQIQQLELDKLDANIKNIKIANARNRFIYIGVAILIIALALWSRLEYVRRSRTAIRKEKEISEGLLLNILPAPVAEELKTKGHAEARQFDDITILFSDFQGFTVLSEKMTPSDLVNEINICFKAFDEIVTKYGIEKIKTIGDAYMAAGGLNQGAASIRNVVLAALEMQSFIKTRKAVLEVQGLPAFEMRLGLHTGPVVAGVVGVKKFQYDLWGDTVNTASRMETHGEVGEINISEETYSRIKDDPGFHFIPRAKMYVKGKGEMSMYFVRKAA